ncbi:MAG: hypothetical protein LBM97_01480 [Candidatus Nomurabacteria bacterium]|jgi:hypothetical protein|nr:hypothetical protein [Candidatus Nomurabacteria bacterium]
MNWEPIIVTGIICFTIIAVTGIMKNTDDEDCKKCDCGKKGEGKKKEK